MSHDAFPFGTQVLVAARTLRLSMVTEGYFQQAGRFKDQRDRATFLWPDGDPKVPPRAGGPRWVDPPPADWWPGEPLDDHKVDERDDIRIRRIVYPVPVVGVVVGRTWIEEGHTESGGYDEAPYWCASRRIDVVQVALPPAVKADITTVLERDLKVVVPS